MRRYYDHYEENEYWVDLRRYPNHQRLSNRVCKRGGNVNEFYS